MTFKAFPNMALAYLHFRSIYCPPPPMLRAFPPLLASSQGHVLTPPCLCSDSTLPRMPSAVFVCLKERLLLLPQVSVAGPCEKPPLHFQPRADCCSLLCFLSPPMYFYNTHPTVQSGICLHASSQMDCRLLQAKTASSLFFYSSMEDSQQINP